MYKYSKWYKELHAQLPQTTIITYPLTDSVVRDKKKDEHYMITLS